MALEMFLTSLDFNFLSEREIMTFTLQHHYGLRTSTRTRAHTQTAHAETEVPMETLTITDVAHRLTDPQNSPMRSKVTL